MQATNLQESVLCHNAHAHNNNKPFSKTCTNGITDIAFSMQQKNIYLTQNTVTNMKLSAMQQMIIYNARLAISGHVQVYYHAPRVPIGILHFGHKFVRSEVYD